MPTTTPNMGMLDPIASTGASGTGDPGPGYATNITNALNTLDSHDHSSGKGVQITPAGMNINADLSFGSNNVTALRAARFTSQASALNLGGDVGEIYVKSGDLWYVNGSGVQVQVTASAGLGTGPVGATGPAGTSFVSSYLQAGVTGFTGLTVLGSVPALVQWNRADLQAGTLSQPTSLGTGSAYVNVGANGLYQISYQLGFTGVAQVQVGVRQTINATGTIAGGTAIPASMQQGGGNGATGPWSLSADYIVQLAQGQNVETWVNVPTGSAALNPTGTLFTITKIG